MSDSDDRYATWPGKRVLGRCWVSGTWLDDVNAMSQVAQCAVMFCQIARMWTAWNEGSEGWSMREDDTLWSCDGYMIHNTTTVLASTVGRGLLLALFRSRGRSRTWQLGRDVNTAGCYDRVSSECTRHSGRVCVWCVCGGGCSRVYMLVWSCSSCYCQNHMILVSILTQRRQCVRE